MDPHDNIPLASLLERKATGSIAEAGFRGACGRAYYAAFGVIRDLLEPNFTIPSQGAHKRVLSLLQTSTNKNVLVAASLYLQLRKTRDAADYDVGKRAKTPFVIKMSQRAILIATQVISDLESEAKTKPRLDIP